MANKNFIIGLLTILIGFGLIVQFLHKPLSLNVNVAHLSNLVLGLITAITYWIMVKPAKDDNPRKPILQVMGGTVFRLFASILFFVVMIVYYKNDISKNNYFFMLFVYMVYMIFDSVYMSRKIKK